MLQRFIIAGPSGPVGETFAMTETGALRGVRQAGWPASFKVLACNDHLDEILMYAKFAYDHKTMASAGMTCREVWAVAYSETRTLDKMKGSIECDHSRFPPATNIYG